MSKVIFKKYGYREYNSEGEKWGLLETNEYNIDSNELVNQLYEDYGEDLWHNMEIVNDKTVTYSVTDFTTKPCIELEITTIEE